MMLIPSCGIEEGIVGCREGGIRVLKDRDELLGGEMGCGDEG